MVSALLLLLLFWLVPFVAALPSVDTRPVAGPRHSTDAAVVIGMYDYGFVTDVPFAREDADAFYTFLVYGRGLPLANVRRLYESTAEEVTAAITEMAGKVGEGGHLWVYFAGHGGMDPNSGARLLLMVDVRDDPASFLNRAVSLDRVRALAPQADPILVVDACFNGLARDGTSFVAQDKRWLTIDYTKSAIPRGVEWTATMPKEAAGPYYAAGHGRFTYFVVGALRGWADGELDQRRNGEVTVEEAHAYVSRMIGVTQVTSQHPVLRTGDPSVALAGGPNVKLETPPADDVFAPAVQQRDDGGMVDGEDLSAKARELAAARARRLAAEQEERDLQARVDADRRTALDADRAALLVRATKEWAALKELVADGGPEGRAAADAYVKKYGEASVVRDGVREPVVVPEAALARAALVKLTPGATVAPNAPLTDTGVAGFGDEGVSIAAGSFKMGSPDGEEGRDDDEKQHTVSVAAFVMGRTEVSQALFSRYKADRYTASYQGVSLLDPAYPAQSVDWCDAVGFANWLTAEWNRTEGAKLVAAYTGVESCLSTKGVSVKRVAGATGWRLPTEAEWEYAARAGGTGVYGATSEAAGVCRYGNVQDAPAKAKFGWTPFPCDDKAAGLAKVGSYAPNAWGLYDTLGNVWEWTGDWYGDYPSGSGVDNGGPASGTARVCRGGSWNSVPSHVRVAFRWRLSPDLRGSGLGLRLARSSP